MHPFIVAHFVADFLLQPKALVNLKNRGDVGTLIHAAIHFVCLFFFANPYFYNESSTKILLICALISASHFVIDTIKIRYQKKHNHASFSKPFLIDQAAHLVITFGAALATKNLQGISLVPFFISYAVALYNVMPLARGSKIGQFIIISLPFAVTVAVSILLLDRF